MTEPSDHHHDNPCQYNPSEPAKIWELLRRNERFQRNAAYVRRLYSLSQLDEDREHCRRGMALQRFTDAIRKVNSFAGTALTWLIPAPTFYYTRPDGWEGKGITPNLRKLKWNEPNGASGNASLWRFGPEIHRTAGGHDYFKDFADYFKDWLTPNGQSPKDERWPFSLNLPWRATPGQFRETFECLWRDIRGQSACSYYAALPREIQSFQGISLMEMAFGQQRESATMPCIDHDANTETETTEDLILERAIEFEMIQRDYRVFVMPKNIHCTAGEIRKFMDAFREQMVREMPKVKAKAEIFGSVGQWEAYFYVQAEIGSGQAKDADEALTHYINMKYGQRLIQPGDKEGTKKVVLQGVKNSYLTTVRGYYQRIVELIANSYLKLNIS